jgi:hypothetical protein
LEMLNFGAWEVLLEMLVVSILQGLKRERCRL